MLVVFISLRPYKTIKKKNKQQYAIIICKYNMTQYFLTVYSIYNIILGNFFLQALILMNLLKYYESNSSLIPLMLFSKMLAIRFFIFTIKRRKRSQTTENKEEEVLQQFIEFFVSNKIIGIFLLVLYF